jgi:hypothetical protein
MGESVNNACTLASVASRGSYSKILFNDLISTNFSEETKTKHDKIGSFNNYSVSKLPNKKILGCD